MENLFNVELYNITALEREWIKDFFNRKINLEDFSFERTTDEPIRPACDYKFNGLDIVFFYSSKNKFNEYQIADFFRAFLKKFRKMDIIEAKWIKMKKESFTTYYFIVSSLDCIFESLDTSLERGILEMELKEEFNYKEG